MTDTQTAFEEHRRLLEGAAYRILGTRTDAEDVVQEAWIRWSTVDPDTVDDARAYLVTITSRLALNKLREAMSVGMEKCMSAALACWS